MFAHTPLRWQVSYTRKSDFRKIYDKIMMFFYVCI